MSKKVSGSVPICFVAGVFGKGGDDDIGAGSFYSAWVLSQSCKAASIRVCQPAPVARKVSTTLGESRIVMRSFVGASCAPRAPRSSLVCNVFGNAEKGLALRASAAVHSGLSVSISSGSGLRFIDIRLSFICLSETYHADAIARFHKHQSVQPSINHTQCTNARFTIISPLVWRKECRFKFKIAHPLKRQTAQLDISGIFGGVIGDFYDSYCTYKIIGGQSQNSSARGAVNDAGYQEERWVA